MQKDQGEWQAALADCDRAIGLDPGNFLPHFNRGNVLRMLGRNTEAIASFDRAIAIAPTVPEPWFNRGVMLHRIGRLQAALDDYDRAVALNPGLFQAHFNRGNVLKELGRPDAALASYDAALAVRGDYPEAHSHRGAALQAMGRWDDALASYDRALALRPDYAEAYFNRGTLHKDRMRWQAALADYNRSLALKPDFADALYNKAIALLTLGDFADGWRLWEWRWANAARLGLGEPRRFRQPLWLGHESLAGQRLLLWCEQGLGDTLQFCRYAPAAVALGADVILEVQAPLTGLLASLPGVRRIVASGSPLPDFDLQCPLLSLPLAFRTTLQTIPAAIPYLRADAPIVRAWSGRLAAAAGGDRRAPRVGLVFSGSTVHGNDRNRSLALADWIPHLPRECQYVCVQKEIRPADRLVLDANPWIACHAAELADFADTAALVEALDLVISVDTSVAHLAGALGKPAWVLLPHNPDWRWMLDRDDTPWYPTLRLFRQPAPGDWSSVFSRLAAELRQLPGVARP